MTSEFSLLGPLGSLLLREVLCDAFFLLKERAKAHNIQLSQLLFVTILRMKENQSVTGERFCV